LAAPGTAKSFSFNIDSFAMFQVKGADKIKAQKDLASAIMAPAFQETFNLNKGSIPVRSGISMDKFDDCGKLAAKDFADSAKSASLLPSVAHGMALRGFTDFSFEWLVDPDRAIYCVAIAGVWQSAGFVMALFLAALRGIDDSIIKAAQVDGASLPRIYWRIIIPSPRPVFFGTLMVVSHLAIKSFDLVMALTAGGPGYATDLPATFMYATAFTRGQIRLGAASATVMLATVAAIVVPYLYSELRPRK